MITVGAVTVSRSDYGIYSPILRRISSDSRFRLALFVGGTHLLDEFARTIETVRADGFDVEDTVDYLLHSDSPHGIAKSMALATLGFADAFRRSRPDILLVLGDRFDMFAAASAAFPQGIPLAHIHGGELSAGALDDSFRHALTKMSHVHFVAAEEFRNRVLQLGEEPWRVHVSGAPSLDNIADVPLMGAKALEESLGMSLEERPVLVTFHPETLSRVSAVKEIDELLAALDAAGKPAVFTHPNADAEGSVIRRRLDEYAADRPRTKVFASLGVRRYFSLMRVAAAMVGNSSSGIIEAASFGLPVVNIGGRQAGRMHGVNVVDVPCERKAIADAIAAVTLPAFLEVCQSMSNPYGDGRAAERIVDVLGSVDLDRLRSKRFVDIPIQ